MGPKGAVEILFKEEIAEAADPAEATARLIEEYTGKFAHPYAAAARATWTTSSIRGTPGHASSTRSGRCAASATATRRRSTATCPLTGTRGWQALAKQVAGSHLMGFMHAPARHSWRDLRRAGTGALIATALVPTALLAQGAIDPHIAPRAAALEREGERHIAIDLLGPLPRDRTRRRPGLVPRSAVSISTTPATGTCTAIVGDPDGLLYLDFAATALDQAIRLVGGLGPGVPRRSPKSSGRWCSSRTRAGIPRATPACAPERRRCRATCSSWGPTSSPRVPPEAFFSPAATSKRLSVWYGSLEATRTQHHPAPPRPLCHRLALPAPHGRGDGRRSRTAGPARAGRGAPQPDALPEPGNRQRGRPRRRLGAVPARPAQPPSPRPVASRSPLHGAAQGLPPERLAVGPRSPRRVRWRRPLQRPPVQLVPPPLRRHAAAGMPSLKPAR